MTHYTSPCQRIISKISPFSGLPRSVLRSKKHQVPSVGMPVKVPTFDPWRFLKRFAQAAALQDDSLCCFELNLCRSRIFLSLPILVVLPKETCCHRPKRCGFFHIAYQALMLTLFLSVVSQSRRSHKKCLSNWLAKVRGQTDHGDSGQTLTEIKHIHTMPSTAIPSAHRH